VEVEQLINDNDPYKDFRQAVQQVETEIDLGRAALAIATHEYPNLDIDAYLSRIEQLGTAAEVHLRAKPDVYRSIAALNYVFFEEHGFRGNREQYFDPKNSFLNEVLDRKTGIPISLSVLYMEVARRIGLSLQGIGFPGHFLVKYVGDPEEIFLDPFNQGEILSLRSLERMLYRLYGGKVVLEPHFLEPTSKKQILRRMLNNLKIIYLRNNEFIKGLSVVERLLIVDPASGEDLKDRGLIYLQLECFKQALEDLEAYLRLTPQAEDALSIRKQIIALTRQVAQIH
jgi:regulator of sirC expression with transglutaminase-like and TPR domain